MHFTEFQYVGYGVKYLLVVLFGTCFSLAQAIGGQNYGGGYMVSQISHPAMIQIFSERGGRCSATLVGPNVLLTAAHCKKSPKGYFEIDGTNYTFTYVTHEDVFPDEYKDFAIGIVDQDVPVKPVAISFTDNRSSKLMALGYGCTRQLSVSFVKIHSDGRETIILKSSDPNDVVFACPGDSGGSVVGYNSKMQLQVVGIQLTTDFKEATIGIKTGSFFAINFFHKAADLYNIQVCGFNLACN